MTISTELWRVSAAFGNAVSSIPGFCALFKLWNQAGVDLSQRIFRNKDGFSPVVGSWFKPVTVLGALYAVSDFSTTFWERRAAGKGFCASVFTLGLADVHSFFERGLCFFQGAALFLGDKSFAAKAGEVFDWVQNFTGVAKAWRKEPKFEPRVDLVRMGEVANLLKVLAVMKTIKLVAWVFLKVGDAAASRISDQRIKTALALSKVAYAVFDFFGTKVFAEYVAHHEKNPMPAPAA